MNERRTTFISILRGINVSGQRVIKISALKKMYENIGFENVQTYLQSGNVIFRSKEKETKVIEEILTSEIKKVFDFVVPVIVLETDTLQTIIQNNPFMHDKQKDDSFFHVTFLAETTVKIDEENIVSKKQNGEEIEFSSNAVYLYCPNGYGRTRLNNNFLESYLNVKATTRNWKTANELLKLAKKI